MTRYLLLLLLTMIIPLSATNYQSRLINMNSCATLYEGAYDISFRFGQGLITGFHVGLTDKFQLGLSYGGDNIVGRGDVNWYPWSSVAHIKYRFFEESYSWPAFAMGVDMQGFGGYGFVYKSQGIFGSFSKSWLLAGALAAASHLDINYSFEENDEVTWPNLALGMDIEINSSIAFLMEYDFAFNEIDRNVTGKSYAHPLRGFTHLGFRWGFFNFLSVQLYLLDLFEQKIEGEITREISITYHSSF